MRKRARIAATALFLSTACIAVDASVYEQPPVVPGAWSISDTVDGTGGRRAHDDFTLATTATLRGITWWGGNVDAIYPYDNPANPDVLQWEISIWADAGGRPGDLLYTETHDATAVTTSQTGTANDPTFGPVPYYRHDLILSEGFLAEAGTVYWLSVLAYSPSTNPWFNWMSGQGGPANGSYTENLGTGQLSFFLTDRAFALNAVPVPAALWLMASALGCLGLRFRTMRKPGSPGSACEG